MNISLSPYVSENLVSRDGFNRLVPRQPTHLHTQAESGAFLRDSSRVSRRRPFMKPPYAIESVPSLSGHAIGYRRCSPPRVRRHRARKPQGSSERVPPWQVTMDQFICASLSHTHHWYEVGMLKVPACRWPYLIDQHPLSPVFGQKRPDAPGNSYFAQLQPVFGYFMFRFWPFNVPFRWATRLLEQINVGHLEQRKFRPSDVEIDNFVSFFCK